MEESVSLLPFQLFKTLETNHETNLLGAEETASKFVYAKVE